MSRRLVVLACVRRFVVLVCVIGCGRLGWAQAGGDTVRVQLEAKAAFPVRSFILPAALFTYGAVAVHNGTLQQFNTEIKEWLWDDNPHRPFHLDNYLQWGPTIAVYALDVCGIHAKHNLRDRTIVLVLANVIANGTTFFVKQWAHELRPSGADYLSFPSGHTTEAFAGAEVMRIEYAAISPWYGVAGYAMATATGLLRIYNNAHWLSDVVGGAGVGIAGARLAYWLYPKVLRILSRRRRLVR